jgi:uncharacterized damage-inducible protein DinB
MPNQLASAFRAGVSSARAKFQQIDETTAGAPLRPGGWTSKDTLGHLIDSALNNQQRFVRASLDGSYEGPTYQQQGWIDMHGYNGMLWSELLAHWQRQNDLLCAVVERIPEGKYGALCKVGTNAPVTLRLLVEDYLVHLHHHADQIAAAVSPGRLFVGYSLEKMQQMAAQVRECVQGLSEEQIWQRSGDNANSIGNLVLHLAGNIRQWIGHGVGGLADVRERDKEFAARGGRSTADILNLFEKTLTDAMQVVKEMPLQRLTERTKPQNRDVAVLEAIYQVVGHLQLHTGQIIFATKQMTGKDLGFFTRAKDTAR